MAVMRRAFKGFFLRFPFRGRELFPAQRWLIGFFVVLFFSVVAVWFFRSQLVQAYVTQHLSSALESKLGGHYNLSIGRVSIRAGDAGPGLYLRDLRVTERKQSGGFEVALARIYFDWQSLFSGQTRVRSLVLLQPHLRLLSDDMNERQSPSAVAPEEPVSRSPAALMADLFDRFERDAEALGLKEFRIQDGTLLLKTDKFADEPHLYDAFQFRYARPRVQQAYFEFEAQSSKHGELRMAVTLQPQGADQRIVEADIRGLPLNDFLRLVKVDLGGATLDGFLDGRARLLRDTQGLLNFESRVSIRSLSTVFGPATTDRLSFDRADVALQWQRGEDGLSLLPSRLTSGEGRATVSGDFRLIAGQNVVIRLQGRDILVPQTPTTLPPIIVETFALDAMSDVERQRLVISSLSLKGPSVNLAASGELLAKGDAVGARVGLALQKTSSQALVRLWPPFVAPRTRAVVERIVQAGEFESATIAVNISPDLILQERAGADFPPESVSVRGRLVAGQLMIQSQLPRFQRVVTEIEADAQSLVLRRFSGQMVRQDETLNVDALEADIRNLHLKDVAFSLRSSLRGSAILLQDLARLSSGDTSSVPPSFDAKGGQIEGKAQVTFVLDAPTGTLKSNTLKAQLQGYLVALKVQLPDGLGELVADKLPITYQQGVTRLVGPVRIDGQAGRLEWQLPDQSSDATFSLAFAVDESWRKKRLPALQSSLRGLVGLKLLQQRVVTTEGQSRLKLELEADLTRASLQQLLPGVVKPQGRPAQLKAEIVRQDKDLVFESFVLQAPSVLVKGRLRLNEQNQVVEAIFPHYLVGGSEPSRLNYEVVRGGAIKLTIAGKSFDARPLLDVSQQNGGVASAIPVELDLDVKSLVGFNSEVISDFRLRGLLKGDVFERLKLTGRVGRGTVDGESRLEQGQLWLVVTTDDAGAFLRFANIYRRVSRGHMVLSLQGRPQPRQGRLLMRDFVVRGEPALRSLSSGGDAAQGRDGTVTFTKMRAEFEQRSGAFYIHDSVVWGPQIGVSLGGLIDPVQDRLDVTGTLIPAYGLNNLFAQVPVLGAFLGGGSEGGVLGVTFKVTGSYKEPELQMNPLSAIAPGFLRKIFEYSRPDADGGPLPVPPSP